MSCRPGRLVTVGGLAALLACSVACSSKACAGPARFPPSVWVHADELLKNSPSTRIDVCASDCTTITAVEPPGAMAPQLVIPNGDDHSVINLRATVRKPHQVPLRSSLAVHLVKQENSSGCGSYVSYAADVHLDVNGSLEPGAS